MHCAQVYVLGMSMPDLAAAIGGPKMSDNQKPKSCQAMEAALLRLIQQPSLAEPVQATHAPPRPAGPPHAGTCQLPEVRFLINGCYESTGSTANFTGILFLAFHCLLLCGFAFLDRM